MNRHDRRKAAKVEMAPTFTLKAPKDTSDKRRSEVANAFFYQAEKARLKGWDGIEFDIDDQSIPGDVKQAGWLKHLNDWLAKNIGPGWSFVASAPTPARPNSEHPYYPDLHDEKHTLN